MGYGTADRTGRLCTGRSWICGDLGWEDGVKLMHINSFCQASLYDLQFLLSGLCLDIA